MNPEAKPVPIRGTKVSRLSVDLFTQDGRLIRLQYVTGVPKTIVEICSSLEYIPVLVSEQLSQRGNPPLLIPFQRLFTPDTIIRQGRTSPDSICSYDLHPQSVLRMPSTRLRQRSVNTTSSHESSWDLRLGLVHVLNLVFIWMLLDFRTTVRIACF